MDHPSQPLEPADLSSVRTYGFAERRNLVDVGQFAQLVDPEASVSTFLDSLPALLAGSALRELCGTIATSHREGREVGIAIGGHVIKCGLTPILCDLLERGIVTGVLMHGATAIHDVEIALYGETSEDVQASLGAGSFGMARETAAFFAAGYERAHEEECGLGRALGLGLLDADAPHASLSVLATCARLGRPCPVVVAVGTDIVHMHPGFDPGRLGTSTYTDFLLLVSFVEGLAGGVWVNIGSAVFLPEAFVKAINLAHNRGHDLDGLVCANLDMLRHYRTRVNVLDRPAAKGIEIIGHHEIILPLLRVGILSELGREREGAR